MENGSVTMEEERWVISSTTREAITFFSKMGDQESIKNIYHNTMKRKEKVKVKVKYITRPVQSKALVLTDTRLSQEQERVISTVTPKMFIKEKPGRGGKVVSYVETGYVVSMLNKTFSPAGWDFEVLVQGETARKLDKNSEGEVWVRGKLTIIDHKKGYRVSKTQYGQHPIHTSVPIGDAYKAAASDCLKKCASLFGIAHDVYWKITEDEGTDQKEEKQQPQKKVKKTSINDADMRKIESIIKSAQSIDMLIQIDQKIAGSPIYTPEQKKNLHKLITLKVDELDSKQA